MSAEVLQQLADRWHCSIADVRQRIVDRCLAAGLLPTAWTDADIRAYHGEPFQYLLTLGVTADDRIAVLDTDDSVLLWLD